MLVQDKYRNIKKFKGNGLISELEVPIGLSVKTKKYDLQINDKELNMNLSVGKSVFVISDVIGVSELSSIVVFFLNDVMVIELVEGCLYIPQEDGSIDLVYAKNNKINKYEGSVDRIDWKTKADIYTYCKHLVATRFNLSLEAEIKDYTNHLMFNAKVSYYLSNNKLFSFSLLDIFFGLGVGKFNYIVKESPIKKNDISPYEFSEEGVNSTEDNVCVYKEKKERKKKYAMSDSIDEDEDDEDALPEHMHEINIFSDYSPESDID